MRAILQGSTTPSGVVRRRPHRSVAWSRSWSGFGLSMRRALAAGLGASLFAGVGASLLTGAPAAADTAASTASPATTERVIVSGRGGAGAGAVVRAQGGEIASDLGAGSAVLAVVTPSARATLETDPSVTVSDDLPMALTSEAPRGLQAPAAAPATRLPSPTRQPAAVFPL